jgi:hypothetical protein
VLKEDHEIGGAYQLNHIGKKRCMHALVPKNKIKIMCIHEMHSYANFVC